ncbi:DUF6492 family protein [Aquimarina spongiae]|uniref:Uncharacterized protein n=1 Tax=Aquimarina spongiae TaxID=570521 RepID=A0A1M6CLP1_9FLAO|nr:DUF6492 family protein [Aquimarina spongiae]SHI61684.1 hypothetical protein SAMN04488508_102167 [Aquimarina spongiae]
MSKPVEFTFVLPTRLKGGRKYDDYFRVKEFLIPSLKKNLIDKDHIELIIIIPEYEFIYFDPEDLGLSNFRYRVFGDKEVIGKQHHIGGWYKQQLIKLAIAGVVTSDYFLTLDADVILCNPISYKDFFQEGKPIIQKELYSYHIRWWQSTAALLHYDIKFDPKGYCPGVTPAVLSKELVIKMVYHLRKHFNDSDWMGSLCRNLKHPYEASWTEYCLYWLFIMQEHNLSSLYCTNPDRILLGKSIWSDGEFHNMKGNIGSQLFEYKNHIFSIVQSNLNDLNFAELKKELTPFIF